MSEVRKVGVLGCGLMGGGIAQVCATAGFETVVREADQEPLDRGMAGINRSLDGALRRERITAEDREAIGARLHPTTNLEDLADCDIVIEAVTEDLALKQQVWAEVDGVVQPGAIFASNTSSLTIAAMAGSTGRAERFVGAALLQPRPGHAAGGGGADGHDLGRDVRGDHGVRSRDRQGAGRGEGSLRLHREPAAHPSTSSTPSAPWSTGSRASRTSTPGCGWVPRTRWARSRWPISSASTRSTASPRTCTPSTTRRATGRRRC